MRVRNLPDTDEAHADFISEKSVAEVKRILINMAWQYPKSRLKLYLDVLEDKIRAETESELDTARALVRELSDGADVVTFDDDEYQCFFCGNIYTRHEVFHVLPNFTCTNPDCPAVRAREEIARWDDE